MIQNRRLWQAWEDALIANEPADFARNLRLYEMIYAQARAMGALPDTDPLDGLADKIQMVRRLHVSATFAETRDSVGTPLSQRFENLLPGRQ